MTACKPHAYLQERQKRGFGKLQAGWIQLCTWKDCEINPPGSHNPVH